jgi:toxin-antitoxin system PIN domain toxin
MMFVVDTNILIYGADRDAPEHDVCRRLILEWREQPSPWYVTWGIVYEFLRVATHPRVFRMPFTLEQAWSFVVAVLASPSIGILSETDRHERVAHAVFSELPRMHGNLIFDAHTAVLMKEHGIKTVYTHDSDFNLFPFLDVIDPIQQTRRTTPRRNRSPGSQ